MSAVKAGMSFTALKLRTAKFNTQGKLAKPLDTDP